MPEYLWNRWYGLDGKFYHKLWNKLDGDTDFFLFEDICETGFSLNQKDDSTLNTLPLDRLNKLYQYSKSMLLHYLLVSIVWNTISFIVIRIFKPVFFHIFMPTYIAVRLLWAGWVIFSEIVFLFFRDMWLILVGES